MRIMKILHLAIATFVCVFVANLVPGPVYAQATIDRFRVTTSLVPGLFYSKVEAEAALRSFSDEASVLQLVDTDTNKDTTIYSYAAVPNAVTPIRSTGEIYRAEYAPAFSLQGPEFSSEGAVTQAVIDYLMTLGLEPPSCGDVEVNINQDWFYLTPNWIFFPTYGHTDTKEIRINWWTEMNPDGSCFGPIPLFGAQVDIYRSYDLDCPVGYTINTAGSLCVNDLTATITEVNLDYDLEPEDCVGNPCNPWTGGKILSFRDAEAPGIVFDRVWRSRVSERAAYAGDPMQDSDLGRMPFGWSHSYGQRVLFDESGIPDAIYRPNGTVVPLQESASTAGVFFATNGSSLQLRETAVNEWTLFLHDGSTEIYPRQFGAGCSAGIVRLESLVDPVGQVTSVEYADECSLDPTTIRGPFGHALQILYQPFVDPATPQSISEIVDSNGERVVYGYSLTNDASGATIQRLDTVTYQDISVETYHYDDLNFTRFITGITDEENIRVSTYAYDVSGRTASTSWAGGFNSWTFDYRTNGEIHARDGRGIETIYVVRDSDFDGIPDSRITIRGGRIVKSAGNDDLDQQRRTSRSDSNQLSATYDFDDFNMTSLSVSGPTDSRVYDFEYLNESSALSRLERGPSSCDDGAIPARQREMETTYVSGTQQVSAVIDRGFSKDSTGSCVAIERTTTYSNHNSFGQPELIDGLRTDVADIFTVAYNECTSGGGCGRPASVNNALGQQWTFDTYDARGNLLKMTRPDGIATEYQYDLRNRLTAIVVTGSAGIQTRTTTFSHYDNGLIRRITDRTGASFDYTYDDARNLREIVDPFGNKVVYDYDLNGNRTLEQHLDSLGAERFRRSFGYDNFDQVNSEFRPASDGGADNEWQWVSDAEGQLDSATDPLGNVTNYVEYDDFQNLTQLQDASGVIAEYAYDPNDNLVSVTAPNGSRTVYEYDDFDRVTSEVSPDRGDIRYTYDDAGNLLTRRDARGILTTYSYDVLNRLALVNLNDGGTIDYDYDNGANAIGRLSAITDASGTTSWTYDNFGAVAQKTQAIGAVALTTSYTYDANGQIDSITYPSGRTVAYSYNLYQTNQVTVDAQTIISGATYEPFGDVNGWLWGDGNTSSRQFNLNGLMTSYSLVNETRTLGYDQADRLTSLLDGRTDESFDYDPVVRLTNYTPAGDSGSGPVFNSTPVLLTSIQTMKNEIGLVPTEPSAPWMTVAAKKVTTGDAKVSLERGQVNTGSIDVKEKIGYVAFEATSGSFVDSGGNTISFEAQITPEFIMGWGTGCFETAFLNAYTSKPKVMASLNSHNGNDGGWLRRCKLNKTVLGLTVDEDKFGDSERRHNNAESAGVVAFSAAFDGLFTDANGTWGMEIAKITLPSTLTNPEFTAVSFRQAYATRPVVIVLPNKSGTNPASLRIRNVTKTGFEVVQVEPAPQDGTHNSMPIHYLAIEKGSHTLPDGTLIEVGRKATRKQKHGSGVVGNEGWATVDFTGDSSPVAVTQVFDYDENGNRTSLSEDGTDYPYSYLTNSNRLLSTAGPVAKSYSYDASGNITSDGTHNYGYDDRGRLVRVDFGAVTYQHNGQGQRVVKDDGSATLFVYGEAGELIGEYDSLGNVIQENVWFGGAPIAVLTDTDTYFVHTDHLGAPRAITNGSDVIWRWTSDPFGSMAAQEDPDGDATTFTYNLRFPGQYFDAETGLHYNYFRTYDPSTGRYLESDPIGLLGGLNTYGYALQNPLSLVDPLGLDTIFDDLIPDGGFPNDLICRQTLRQGCNRARALCAQLACGRPGTPTTCKVPCQNAAAQCKVEADEFCTGQDFGDEEDDLPQESQRSYDAEGCYWEYRRNWWGKRRLQKICPDDKDYRGEQCTDSSE